MKQIVQNLKNGETLLMDIPTPKIKKGHLLIRSTKSLVSLGTEKMLVEFGKAGLISKARQQPDKVAMVLDKIKAEGLLPTIETVFKKLEEPLPLGYCNVGTVVEIGEGVKKFKIGDRVASNGQHAEYVLVPENLAAPIPDTVSDAEAAFTVIGSIGLQGIRLLNPAFGDTVVVYGLGLIGLLTAQLLKANGCRVVGIDLDDSKIKLAESFGIEAVNPAKNQNPVQYINSITNNNGADGVIITASTKSNEVISLSAQMSRKRGKIVLVGVIGLQLSRAEFYEKELTFQVSCSYGPGRYDDNYEQKGIDYPLPFVRWTENRNFVSILQAIANKSIDVKSLITEDIPFEDFIKIYGNMKSSSSIASLFSYAKTSSKAHSHTIQTKTFEKTGAEIGIIGAGNFTKMTLLPILKKHKTSIKYIASSKGLSGTFLAKKYGIAYSTSDYKDILEDDDVRMVIITTRHNLHASMTLEALQHGKDVFVEKPLALTREELDKIIDEYKQHNNTVTVGFNRRFSPFAEKMKELIGGNSIPINVIATMNAGHIPQNVWVHDLKVGGGRIIGEACHFIDLITFLTGSKVEQVFMSAMGTNPGPDTDNASLILKYKNGSQGVINYFSNGHKSYSKERVEVYSEERNLILDNFRSLKGYGFKGFTEIKSKLNKGHDIQFRLLIDRLQNGGEALIPFDELVNTTQASIAALESLKLGTWISLK